MTTWINSDGLPVKFGLDEAKLGKVAEYETDGSRRVIEVVIDGAEDFAAFGTTAIIDDNCALPKGVIVELVRIGANSEAFAGSGATLSIGTIDKDRTSNGVATSILDTASVAEMNAGGDDVSNGALVQGAALPAAKLLTVTVGTANFTAGKCTVEISYVIPKKGEGSDTLVYTKA